MDSFDTAASLAIIILAAAIHASFQLSISVLTLLSGHALGAKTAHHRLVRLQGGFIFGAGVMTLLLVSATCFIFSVVVQPDAVRLVWAALCGGAIGVAVSVWLFYYRGGRGTSLWVPRGFARFLHDRSKATKSTGEAFGLGLTSVASEILYTFAPLSIAALLLIRLRPDLQLLGVLGYSGVVLLPLLIVGILIGSGHKLSHIQRWREHNKYFLQFAAGSGLLVLACYVYVIEVMSISVIAPGGY